VKQEQKLFSDQPGIPSHVTGSIQFGKSSAQAKEKYRLMQGDFE
jgi:hypothetical protein